jgi:hypothetical protein
MIVPVVHRGPPPPRRRLRKPSGKQTAALALVDLLEPVSESYGRLGAVRGAINAREAG